MVAIIVGVLAFIIGFVVGALASIDAVCDRATKRGYFQNRGKIYIVKEGHVGE